MKMGIIIIALVLTAIVFAETPLLYIGSELWSNFEYINAEGDYLFAGFPYGVGVFDISDSLDCHVISTFYLGENVSDIAVSGNYLYVAAHNRGVVILDKTDPEHLTFVGETDVMDEIVTIELQGDYAYCGGKLSGFHIIDVSSPTSPWRVAFVTMYGGMSDIQVDGDYAYIIRGLGGLAIADISDPTAPDVLGSISSTSYFREAAVLGDYLAVASDNTGVTIIDITDPNTPTSVTSYPAPTSGAVTGVTLHGNTIYAAASNYGVVAIDVSSPTSPEYIDHYPTSITTVLRVEYADNLVYFSTPEGLQVLDVTTDPDNLTFVSREDRHSYIDYIWASGSRMLTASGNFGIDGFNLADMEDPDHTFHYRGGMSFDGAFYLSDYIYAAAGSDDLMIFESAGLYDFPTPVTSVAVSGNALDVQLDMLLCYVLTTEGLAQVNVYDPTSPSLIAEAVAPNPKAFAATPEFVYICDRTDGFLVFDPLSMTRYAEEPAGAGKDYSEVNVVGEYAYASAGDDGILIFDISDPSSPELVAEYETEDDAEGIAISGEWLYIAMDRDGVQPFKIIAPGDSLVAYDPFETGGAANDVHADLNYIFVADRDALLILRNSEFGIEEEKILPAEKSLRVSPNPFNSSCKIELPTNSIIAIYNLKGDIVSSPLQFDRINDNEVVWTPPKNMRSGIFLAKAKTGNREYEAKLILVK